MKKLRNLLAVVSAVAVCAVSITPIVSNAIALAFSTEVTPYTVSFTVNNEKYVLWQEASDCCKYDEETLEALSYYMEEEKVTCYDGGMNVYYNPEYHWVLLGCSYRFYRYEDGTTFVRTETCPLIVTGWYSLDNENERETLENYLTDNNITYTVDGNYIDTLSEERTMDENMKLFMDIKENTGFVCPLGLLEDTVQITDVENALPEKTLDGDANEDGKVDMADAAAIIQHIGNNDKYGLTIQGEANADCYKTGDGVTGMDAIAIQKLEAGLIETLDEA